MVMHNRDHRWPSSWETELVFKHAGRMLVEIRNVSSSGMRCSTEYPVKAGDLARITLNGTRIQGTVVRSTSVDAAIHFQSPLLPEHLALLRQFRRLHSRRLG